jgi:hypothetical protein
MLEIPKEVVLLRRQEKCLEAIVQAISATTHGTHWSKTMFSAMAQPVGLIFYRACVALQTILAARKRPPGRRVRKAAVILAACFVDFGRAYASEEIPAPPSRPVDAQADAMSGVPNRPIRTLRTSIAPPAGDLPTDYARLHHAGAPQLDAAGFGGRGWFDYAYLWQASALSHRPLYFEEPSLERYGHRARFGLQPALSGAHFFATSAALPVKMALDRPWKRHHTLGYGRPGGDAPWQHPR